jgi:hypothetical protein
MNAALRTTLGWIAAALLNVGAMLFLAGLILPRASDPPALTIGIVALTAGVVIGTGWLAGGRGRR